MTIHTANDSLEIISKWRADPELPLEARVVLEKTSDCTARTVLALLSILVTNYKYDYFKDLVRLVAAHEKELEKNPNAMIQASFAAWSKGIHEDGERWSKKLISLAPRHPSGYLRLGLSCLTSRKFVDAFLALSAGLRNTNEDQQLKGWFHLAERMALGQMEARFEKFGKKFCFRMTCFNTQAVESDLAHLTGRFTEERELEFLAGALQGCKSCVEVGALVGNHTVFLATTYKPKNYLVVDADERSICETSANVELNRGNYPQTTFRFVESALAGASGEDVRIGPKSVTTRTLEELLPEDVDFLKIDIDGMEGPLLEPLVRFVRDKSLRIFIEVQSPLLTEYEKKMGEVGYKIVHRSDHGNYSNLFFQRPD
jgi:FkbM family methyltransferase